jgi:hypothetical protein
MIETRSFQMIYFAFESSAFRSPSASAMESGAAVARGTRRRRRRRRRAQDGARPGGAAAWASGALAGPAGPAGAPSQSKRAWPSPLERAADGPRGNASATRALRASDPPPGGPARAEGSRRPDAGQPLSLSLTHSLSHSLSLARARAHTHTHSLAPSRSCPLCLSASLSVSLSRTLACSISLAPSPSLPLSPARRRSAAVARGNEARAKRCPPPAVPRERAAAVADGIRQGGAARGGLARSARLWALRTPKKTVAEKDSQSGLCESLKKTRKKTSRPPRKTGKAALCGGSWRVGP